MFKGATVQRRDGFINEGERGMWILTPPNPPQGGDETV